MKRLGILLLAGLILAGTLSLVGCSESGSGEAFLGGIPENMMVCAVCDASGVCKYCDGTGRKSNGRQCTFCDGSKVCSSCEGEGYRRLVYVNGKEYVECMSCHGNITCSACRGSGKSGQTLMGKKIDCSLCDGSGKCGSCKGKGYTIY